MIIEYPNVKLTWFDSKHGLCGLVADVTDVKAKRYGYNLESGQKVYMVGYYDRGHTYCYHATIKLVSDIGIILSDWMEKGWKTDSMAEFVDEDGDAILPWEYEGHELYIQPCDDLFEDYRVRQLIDGLAPKSHPKYLNGKRIPDPRGEGWFHKHGGWRCNSPYQDNLKNFEMLGQMSIEDLI